MTQTFSFAGLLALFLAFALPVVGAQPGSIDPSFNPGAGVDQSVFALAIQDDGKILIGGDFTLVDNVSRASIARLHPGGAVDEGFNPGLGANDLVSAVAIQSNKVIIAGFFTEVDGVPRASIARLNSNGSLDMGFAPGAGADGPILALAVQGDGKILVGGLFTAIDNVPRGNIARLNGDGSLDPSFNPGSGVTGEGFSVVNALALQPDGKVVLGGSFTNVNDVARSHVARLNTNGDLDQAFNPVIGVVGGGLLAGINSLAIQSDGGIVLGGDFTSAGGLARTNVARITSSGSVDQGFNPGNGANATVSSVAVQSNGKIVLSGFFTQVNGAARQGVARLNTGGSVDTEFQPGLGANDAVYVTALQTDGKVLIGGAFSTYNSISRDGVARLEGDTVLVRPRLFDLVRSGNTFRVSVQTVLGRSYTLQFKNDLGDSDWTPFGPIAGDGTVKMLQDIGAAGSQRIYRVMVQ